MGVALLLGGCAVGGGDKNKEGEALREDLAVPAQPLTFETEPAPATTAGGSAGSAAAGRAGNTTTTSTRPASGSGATTTVAPGSGRATAGAPYVTLASTADGTGDATGTSTQKPPAYGDLTRLLLEDGGTRARFTVEVAADVPARLANGEQMAVGVDLFRGARESEFQVYARGNDEGWLAWLQGPSGLVEYPGTFELGGNRLVFTVPWSDLGGRRAGALAVFAEWEQAKVAVVADESRDRAPNSGAQSYSF